MSQAVRDYGLCAAIFAVDDLCVASPKAFIEFNDDAPCAAHKFSIHEERAAFEVRRLRISSRGPGAVGDLLGGSGRRPLLTRNFPVKHAARATKIYAIFTTHLGMAKLVVANSFSDSALSPRQDDGPPKELRRSRN